MTSGEGGCIVSNDQAVLQKIADARLLGVKKDTEMRYSGKRSWQFDVDSQGWRAHMSNIMAAIGLVQLNRFSELSSKRQKLARYYDKKLEKINTIIKFKYSYKIVLMER
jgi:dTDP-4-amino-4,6-dideoxygalactose transaminase